MKMIDLARFAAFAAVWEAERGLPAEPAPAEAVAAKSPSPPLSAFRRASHAWLTRAP